MPATPRDIDITPQDVAEAKEKSAALKRQLDERKERSKLGEFAEEARPFFEDEGLLTAYDLDQLEHLPEPAWLLESIIEEQGFSALAGEYGLGKTFMALDWALSLAHGFPAWMDFAIPRAEPQKVIYVLAEGFGWAHKRIEAWQQARDVEETVKGHMLMVQEQVRLWPGENSKDTESQERILRTVEAFEPELIVFDTYARTTPGMNENSASEAGKVVSFIDQLRLNYGCAALLLHHPTKQGNSFRGSNAGPGAADVVVVMKEGRNEGEVVLEWDKIKNGARPEDRTFIRVPAAEAVVLDQVSQAPPPPPRGPRPSSKRQQLAERFRSGEFDGMTMREVAEQEGVSVGLVHKAKAKAEAPDEPEEVDEL